MSAMRPRILRSLAGMGLVFAAWFLLAGRVAWPQAWAFLSVFLIPVSAFAWLLARRDPALLRERSQTPVKGEPWDRAVMRLYPILLLVLMVVVALDGGRYRWSVVPPWVQLIGWVLCAMCGTVVWHVSTKNTYLSRYARIQNDRDQVVVRDGLYGHVRHPMYLGIILLFSGLPLVLGSWWAYIPSTVIACLFVYRTHREDRMLQDGLAGYPEDAQDVRYRLVPGIW